MSPIFDIVNGQPTKNPFLIEAVEEDISFNGDTITFILNSSNLVVRKAKMESEIAAFNEWRQRRQQNPEIDIRLFLAENEAFESIRRSFHFQNN